MGVLDWNKALSAGSESGDSDTTPDDGETPDDNDGSPVEQHLRAMWRAGNAGNFKLAADCFSAATTAHGDAQDSDAEKGATAEYEVDDED